MAKTKDTSADTAPEQTSEPAPRSDSASEPRTNGTEPDGSDNLDGLLREFDEAVAPSGTQPPAPEVVSPSRTEEPPQKRPDHADLTNLEAVLATPASDRGYAERKILVQHAMAIDAERTAMVRGEHDRRVLQSLLGEHAETLTQLRNLPHEMIALRIAQAEQSDPQLMQLVDRRYNSAEDFQRAMAAARKTLGRAVERLVEENARRDPENRTITEDRELVAQSMRAARYTPPAPKPVNVSKLSDRELSQHVETTHGYKPNF